MGEPGRDAVGQLNSGVSVTIVKVMCGSPAGMGQLIKYFESQSRRLDRQMFQSCPSSLNPDFESAIKFNGVPILPPAITSSRRDELRQYKKDAVLLEKRLKARHRRELLAKADSLVNQSQVYFPDTSSRQAARQLNFDEPARLSHRHDYHGGTDSCSTVAVADTGNDLEDFGLQTMDSVNSDFMSLDSESIPKVFSGLVLTSIKEQKISYDLDRLSKALNVQDMTSTSGSDLSDAFDFTYTQDGNGFQSVRHRDLQSALSLEDKLLTLRAAIESDAHSASLLRNNQGTFKVSLESGKVTTAGNTSIAGFVESANLEQAQNSHSSSPACGSANTSTATESLGSNRSSPKSLKSGVHFASFVTEYISTSASQSLEYPTVVKKKMSSEHSVTKEEHDADTVLPIIGDPSEFRRRSLLSRKGSNSENGSLLNNVSFCLDNDSAPFNDISHVPAQGFGRFETNSSDKENDVPQLYKNFPQGHKRSFELANKLRQNSEEGGSTDSLGHESRQQRISREEKIGNPSTSSESRSRMEDTVTKNSILLHTKSLSHAVSFVKEVDLSQDLASLSAYGCVGASHNTFAPDSAPLIFESTTLAEVAVGRKSVSDSQGSSKSNTLSHTSESSSSTVREDFPKDRSDVAMNILDMGLGFVSRKTDQRQERPEEGDRNKGTEGHHSQSDSPKKLNIDASIKESETQEKLVTPSRTNICRNSYTLSEPSPALVQAHGRPETERRGKNNDQGTTKKGDRAISDVKHPSVAGHILSPKRLQSASVHDVDHDSHVKIYMLSDAEKEGKAEHINKYLNQVQFQNSINFTGQSWDTRGTSGEDGAEDVEEQDEVVHPLQGGSDDDCHTSVLEVLRSIAESNGSLEQLTVEELLELHQQQMNEKRQTLIRQQQRDMEELFIQQRREVMLLESEIKAAQEQEREQQKFLMQNAPENIKMKSRNQDGEYSPVQTDNFESADIKHWQQKPVAKSSVNLSDNVQAQAFHQVPSGIDTPVTSLKLQPKSYTGTGMDMKSDKFEEIQLKSHIQRRQNITMMSSPDSTNEDHQTRMKTTGDNFCFRTVSSVDAMGVASRIPEFSPSVASPRMHRQVVLRSPLKYTSLQNQNDRVIVPPETYLPEMQIKFDKLTAAAKGFLTRRLIKSDRVQELIKTIKDTREFAFNFQTETPIKKGMFTSQDKVLLERIIAQLQAALLDIHEIFFDIPVTERLALIEHTRLLEQEKRAKAASRDNMRESVPKISQATLKALERKRKSRETEASAVMITSRPKTAPPRTSSPQHSSHMDSRALKPLQGHSQISPIRPDTNRPEKGRSDTAKEKQPTQPKRIIAVSSRPASILVESNSDSHKKGSVKLSVVTNKPVMKSKPAASKPSNRPLKSWR